MASDAAQKIVAVTGASAGVGRAIALAFAQSGARVAAMARSEIGLDSLRREIEAGGSAAAVFALDVADAKAVFAAADEIVDQCGAVDVWVNCAMVTIYAPVAAIDPDEYRRVTEVTYLGYVYGTMAALKHMRARNAGHIIQIGSALSYRAIPLQSAYCGGKFAIRGFTDSLRSELHHDKSAVRLTMIQLPAVNTPQFDWARNKTGRMARPLPPIFEPEAIARHVVRAASSAPRELWVGWSAVKAILGTMVLPAYLDRKLATTAYKGELSEERRSPDQIDNLDAPPPAGHVTRGRFEAEAKPRVRAFRPTTVRLIAVLLATAVISLLTYAASILLRSY